MSASLASFAVLVDGRHASEDALAACLDSLVSVSLSPRVLSADETDPGAVFVSALDDAELLVVLDGGARLMPDALQTLGAAFERFPEIQSVYGDDDEIRRPEFSPIRLRSQDYLGAIRVFRSGTARTALAAGPLVPGAESLDLFFRLAEADAPVLRLPSPLSSRIEPEAFGEDMTIARRTAVGDHLERLGVDAEIDTLGDGTFRLRYAVVGEPLVSIVIPTRGGDAVIAGSERVLVVEAVRSILDRSNWAALEFVVVADDATPQTVIDDLVELAGERLRLVRWSEPFNFSAKMNRGALFARGEYLLLLNDDTELVSGGWIEELVGLAQQPGIGLVGTMLYFDDGTVQHGGHLYRGGQAGHIAHSWPPEWNDPLRSMGVVREVSGATAACAMIPADDFWEVGGFSNLFPGNYNDVDLCLKLRSIDRSILWTPYVRLYHFESKSRVATIAPSELTAIQNRWASRMQVDAYWPSYVD
ncbi:glycosyltransferase family 2 protein [Luethyella okanaganae]|uniref:Glycosyltransferase n=1 Tax=Luethyella okanaganae TaxID=69372 RepID=A0ABW1VB59_9MICO